MPITEKKSWRSWMNRLTLEVHQFAWADFDWRGRNVYSFNRIFWVAEGRGSVIDHGSGAVFGLQPGMGLFMPAGADLEFVFEKGLRFVSCHFNLYGLPGVELLLNSRCREFPASREDVLLLANAAQQEPRWDILCRAEGILWQIFAQIPVEDFAGWMDLTRKYGNLLEYIEQHLSARLDVAQLAEIHGCGRSTLSRNFSGDFGMPLKTFLQKALVRKASEMLREPDRSIREIARELEFSSEYYFSLFFRRHTGNSPSGFRRSHFR